MVEEELTSAIIGAAINLHKKTGPGLLESVYKTALAFDLREMGLRVRSEVPLPFIYKGIKLDVGYRIDLMVENKVIIEIKSVVNMPPVYFSQILTYIKLSGKKVGLLINFNSKVLIDGVHRFVN